MNPYSFQYAVTLTQAVLANLGIDRAVFIGHCTGMFKSTGVDVFHH